MLTIRLLRLLFYWVLCGAGKAEKFIVVSLPIAYEVFDPDAPAYYFFYLTKVPRFARWVTMTFFTVDFFQL